MDPITVALQSKGVNEVKAALRGVHEAIEQIDKVSSSAGKNAFANRLRGIKKELGAGQGGSFGGGNNRASMSRVLGGDSSGPLRRASSGPTVGEYAGLASSSVGSMIGTVAKFGAVGGAIAVFTSALDMAGAALSQFGGFLISDVIKPAFALETAAQQLSNSSGGAVSAQDIQDKTRAAALKHNMDPTLLLEAASKMIDLTGDAKTSFDLLDTIGTLSKSRGADAGELADFAATLKNFDPNASAEQISALLMTQLAQGDKGSVPLKEAARLGGRLTAPAAFLAGNTDVKMASMGALMQTARKGFGSTDELATGIGNLINEVSSQKMVGSRKYLNKDGQIGDVASLIGGILKDTGGDAKKIGALGLSDPASKLVKAYPPAFGEAGKGDKGKEAVEGLIRGFMEASTSLESEKDNERKVLQTSGEKWNATIEGIKNKLLDIMPEVEKLVDSLAQKGPDIASALTSIAKALVAAAAWINDWFGDDDASQKDVTTVDSATGAETTIKQYEIDERGRSDAFNPSAYQGGDLTAEEFDAAEAREKAAAAAPPALPDGSQPAAVPSFMFNWQQPPKDTPVAAGAPNAGKSTAELDTLGQKANAVGIMFDKLTASGNDLARTKPLGQR